MSTTKLERESLEAHVDLCAERYGHVRQELNTLKQGQAGTNSRLDSLESMIKQIHTKLADREVSAMRLIVKFTATVIVTLIGALGGVIWYVITL